MNQTPPCLSSIIFISHPFILIVNQTTHATISWTVVKRTTIPLCSPSYPSNIDPLNCELTIINMITMPKQLNHVTSNRKQNA
ncbi:hypothetical protein JHK82_039732 [Glycine max]|nr:hypothetical protein JHK82_039732 [Glycine max]KAG5121800.1 hypothetical protein JHK84_040140 [Glycine max]